MNNTVCLCGSTRFLDAFSRANIELTKCGLSVITISMCLPKNEHDTEDEVALKELLDLVHLNKIMRSDAVFIVGDGYFGRSTAREIIWAEMHGKPVIVQKDCRTWEEAVHRIKYSVVETYIFPEARRRLGLTCLLKPE